MIENFLAPRSKGQFAGGYGSTTPATTALRAHPKPPARAANCCNQMPERFDRNVGERGNRPSVSECQRVTTARALIKKPPVLILDDATSAGSCYWSVNSLTSRF
ncbi:MAG TPA: ATP-binding cassette domain-containing protein [Verrucomicrobiae bacterium]|nr:ATP-binding cassette domain-containing protein [Verrucomicrobiae bacterium]